MAADTPPPVNDQSRLLDVLRENAAKLTEPDLPTTEELRGVVGALVQALERIAGEQVDAFAHDAEPEPVEQPGYVEVNPGASPTPPPEPVVVTPPAPPADVPPADVPPAPPADVPPAPPANPGAQA